MAFDYSEFKQLRKNFSIMTREFDSWIHNFLLDEGMRFIREVKFRTPVDTGDLRNHWRLEGVKRSGNALQVSFVNTMNYASFVEYGHAKPYKSGSSEGSSDWVDGYFMMTVSIEVIQRELPTRFNNEFQIFLSNMGVN